MSADNPDDNVASLGSVGSDFQRAHDDLAIRHFLVDDRHCARSHARGNCQHICHRPNDKCKCDHNIPPKGAKLSHGLCKIHRKQSGAMIGAQACRKLEGEELTAYLESKRKLNQDMTLLATGMGNLQSPAPPRHSQRHQETTEEKAPAQKDPGPAPKTANPASAVKQPTAVHAMAPVPPKSSWGKPTCQSTHG